MSNDDIILHVSKKTTPLEYANELTAYIEQASCAVSVLGDLLKAMPPEDMEEGQEQSIGFLLNIIGDGMMYKSEFARNFITRMEE
jgi:hypothetical protein